MTVASSPERLVVPAGTVATRIDQYLAAALGKSRSWVQHQLRAGLVTVDGQAARAGLPVRPGFVIVVDAPAALPPAPAAPDLPVVYEDDDLLVVDKPAGLVVHPVAVVGGVSGGASARATVADFAKLHTSDMDLDRPGIVHRLDRDTSGLLIIAKTAAAKATLQQQFRDRAVAKTYLALVVGTPDPAEASINLPLARDPVRALRRRVDPAGNEAVTNYRVAASYPGYSLVEARPRTGRTHQLRVHFAAIGHPIAGDMVYGSAKRRPLGLARHFLHAADLAFTTPAGRHLKLTSPLPADLATVLDRLSDQV